jgi:hypothetical protein
MDNFPQFFFFFVYFIRFDKRNNFVEEIQFENINFYNNITRFRHFLSKSFRLV